MREPQQVDTADDPRLAPFAQLQRGRRGGQAVVEGAIPTVRALASSYAVSTVVSTPSHVERLRPHVGEQTAWLCASKDVLAQVAGFAFHRGVLAAVDVPQPAAVSTSQIERLVAAPRVRIAAALGLSDPSNVGALVRASRAFEIDLLVLDHDAADPFGRKAIRASAGQVFSQPIAVCADPWRQIERLREVLSAPVLATTPGGETCLRAVPAMPASIVVFGPEGPGLAPEHLAAADVRVRVPMAADVDSLNVAACSAVVFYALAQPPT